MPDCVTRQNAPVPSSTRERGLIQIKALGSGARQEIQMRRAFPKRAMFAVPSWINPLVLAVVALVLAGRSNAAPAEKQKACSHFHLVELTDIIGRAPPAPDGPPALDLCVPHGYLLPPGSFLPLDYFKPWLGVEDAVDGLNITAKWPSMESVWDKPLPSRKDYDPSTHGNLLDIMLALSTSYKSVDYQFNAEKRLLNAIQPAAPQFGLEHLVPDPSTRWPKAELYFKPERVHTSYVSCKVPSYAPYPGCKETFEYHGYLIEVSYSIVFLPLWQDIEEKVKLLITSFAEQK
jgi:hypothetical protein